MFSGGQWGSFQSTRFYQILSKFYGLDETSINLLSAIFRIYVGTDTKHYFPSTS